MAYKPKQLWQLSILDVAGIVTIGVRLLLIVGVAYFDFTLMLIALAQTA
jgi:hypothetical protein